LPTPAQLSSNSFLLLRFKKAKKFGQITNRPVYYKCAE